MKNEVWKDIPNYEGFYQASNLGRIRSIRFKRVKVLKPNLTRTKSSIRYHTCLSINKKVKTCKTHRLVISAFKGESNMIVDHINGNPLDNRIENLRYCSQRDNLTFSNVKRKRESPYFGVTKRGDKWRAMIWVKDRIVSCGTHKTDIDAHNAYIKARDEYMRGGVI